MATKCPVTFNEQGYAVGSFPADCVAACSASGQVIGSVQYWQMTLGFTVPRRLALRYLAETGAWTRAELDEMSDTELAEKVLWLACCNLKESGEGYGLVV